ncbi:MFS transporter [Terrabacter tumescens]|uniref:MFS transporter n=1 Tax=Terrabacter tumescens TaxID=60443 RepID=A0ABQ2HN23_9MICO|nr:MFS transporter [Terrabacter tumescens]GGM85124.1 MFS transporter [Terrabacter tumescens]
MTFLRALFTLLRGRGFRRLFVSRVTSSFSDGVFQVALASHVLFNPEQAADAQGIAIAFAIVLLPYSALGPFVGVLLDRWPRRRVIVISQLVRAAAILGVAGLVSGVGTGPAFFGLVLLVFSVNRFILAGLSSAMPHVVPRESLVSANSVAPTCGSLAYLLGGAVGTGLRALGGSDVLDVLLAAAGVVAATWAATRLPFIGPDDTSGAPSVGQITRSVVTGLAEAVRTLPRRARLLLVLVFLTRIPFGFLLLQTLLLFRGPFESGHGARGFGIAAAASAVGFASAAFVTPWLAPRLTAVPYAARMLALGAFVCAVLGPFLTPWSIVVVGFFVSFTSQCVKITVDSLLQAHVDDHLLGRAFSAYDVVYNAGMVAAAALGALVLPATGLAWWPLASFAVIYAGAAMLLGRLWSRATVLDHERPLG